MEKVNERRIAVIIPALNEAPSIAKVLTSLPRERIDRVIVVDNGSTDGTAEIARSLGADVVSEPRRGYGRACLTGIAALPADFSDEDVVVFLDADASDRPEELPDVVAPILQGEADLVIGSRTLGKAEPGALLPQARWGNRLAVTLIRALYGTRYTDLGPFRAIRSGALSELGMRDTNYGWTVEMQVRAARKGLRVVEVPVSYRRRIGVSKITGTVRGTVGAGTKILLTIFRHGFPSGTMPLFLGAIVGLLAWIGIAALDPIGARPVPFLLLYLTAFAAYGLAVRTILPPDAPSGRAVGGLILLAGLGFRLSVFGNAPSDDIYRYLWEGKVQQAGFNPYVHPPTDPALDGIGAGDPYRDHVNHPDWTAIYGPAAMLSFRAIAAVAYHPAAMKIAFLLIEGIGLLLLLRLLSARGIPRARVLIYWWNPLAILAVAMEGHLEPLMVTPMLLALLLVGGGKRGGVFALAVAALVKPIAAVAFPALLGRVRIRSWILPATAIFLCILPVSESLLRFGAEKRYNDSLHGIAAAFLDPAWSRGLLAAGWLFFAGWVVARTKPDPIHRTALLLGALVLVLPTVHPWYLLMLLPWLCFYPWPGWIALSGTFSLYYLPQLEIWETGVWTEWLWLRVPIYAPLFLWLLWIGIRRWNFDSGGIREREPLVSQGTVTR